MNRVRLTCSALLILLSAFLSGQALADVITLTFPLVSGAGHTTGFPLPPVTVGTQTFTIPAGQHIVSATASGILGNTGSTAAVDVDLDGVMVAQQRKRSVGVQCHAVGEAGLAWAEAEVPGVRFGLEHKR